MKELHVMIVDDEIMAIEYLKELIPWEQYGFQVVAAVTDAREALGLFQTLRPQLIISDIRMPGLNGLDFCTMIKALDNGVKILLLTAYQEFDFAKKAIELGVFGYLLKHEISPETMVAQLEKIRQELENEAKARRIMTRNELREILEGNFDFTQYGAVNHFEQSNGKFALLLVKKDEPYPFTPGGGRGDSPNSVPETELLEWLGRAVDPPPEGIFFIDYLKLPDSAWVLLFRHQFRNEAEFWNRFYPRAAVIRESISRATGGSYSGAVTIGEPRLRNLSGLYREACHLLTFVPFLGTEKISRRQDVTFAGLEQEPSRDPEAALQLIGAALQDLNTGQVTEGLESLFMQYIIPSRNSVFLRSCCEELIRLLHKWRRSRCGVVPGELSAAADHENLLAACYTVNEIHAALREVMIAEVRKQMEMQYRRYSKKVQKAIRYMQGNYARDISVWDVAEAVAMSDSHLGRIFKTETGQTVLEYLTAIRIEAAKALLAAGNCKIYEVAERVGYKTSQYFSQVFIRMTGVNPAEYRERSQS